MAMWREVRAFTSSHNTPLLSSLSPSLGKFFFSLSYVSLIGGLRIHCWGLSQKINKIKAGDMQG